MFKSILIASLPVMTALAMVSPNAPTPGTIFKEGGDCTIGWDVDTTGKWTTMNIELMAGPNLAMQHLTTVATVDGTDATKNTFTYTCPGVTPNSAIYFYQFSSPAEPTNLTWTGRFAISDASGNTTPPPNATQPTTNDPIPWGNAQLADPSTASPAPTYLASGGGVVVASTASTNGTTAVVSSTSTIAPAGLLTSVVGSATGTSSASTSSASPTSDASNSTTSPNNNTVNGAASLDVSKRGLQAVAALTGTALAFLTIF